MKAKYLLEVELVFRESFLKMHSFVICICGYENPSKKCGKFGQECDINIAYLNLLFRSVFEPLLTISGKRRPGHRPLSLIYRKRLGYAVIKFWKFIF